jgi:hypothetical protein
LFTISPGTRVAIVQRAATVRQTPTRNQGLWRDYKSSTILPLCHSEQSQSFRLRNGWRSRRTPIS